MQDAGCDRDIADKGAAEFLRLAFGVDDITKKVTGNARR